MATKYDLSAKNVKINRQGGGTNNIWVKWSLTDSQKKMKITKKVYNSKKKKAKSKTVNFTSVISGYTIKWYYKVSKGEPSTWYLDKTIEVTSGYSATSHDLWTPPDNAVMLRVLIKPKSKTYQSSASKTASWFSADYTAVIESYYDEVPSAPSIDTFEILGTTLKASVLCSIQDFDRSGKSAVRLQVLKDGTKILKLKKVDDHFEVVEDDDAEYYAIEEFGDTKGEFPSSGIVPFIVYLKDVGSYQVRGAFASHFRDSYMWSEYSSWASSMDTRPQAPTLLSVSAIAVDKVRLTWSEVDNVTKYKIEYVNDSIGNFDSDQIRSVTVENLTSYIISGLDIGHTVYFRVRSVNNADESSPSDPKSITLSAKPTAPTTWSSSTKASITPDIETTDKIYLYWIHNTADGSAQQYAHLEFNILGTTYYLTKENTERDEFGELIDKTTKLSLWDTIVYHDEANSQAAGTIYSIFRGTGASSIKWKVATKGSHSEYSDWSIERVIEGYEKPNIELIITDKDGLPLVGTTLTSFPMHIAAKVTPISQQVISYHMSITANESYETTDIYGNDMTISAGTEIFSKYTDGENILDYTLNPEDVDFQTSVTYLLTVVAYTNVGLNAKSQYTFTVSWHEWDTNDMPSTYAVVEFNSKYRYADIVPSCISFMSSNFGDVEPVAYMGTEITGNVTDTVFPSVGIAYANVGDMYLNSSTNELYVCTYGGDPSTSKWTYKTTYNFSDIAGWRFGNSIDKGEDKYDTDIYPDSGIEDASINEFYLNTKGDIFKCIKSGAPRNAVWQYIWNCFWQLTPNVKLSVYRKEPNGRYVLIKKDMDNSMPNTDTAIVARDPHPSFNTCVYRIVATDTETGAIASDDEENNFEETSVVIQWDEVWRDVEIGIDEDSEELFEGSILELPANIKISDQNSNDVNMVNYIGRERPVTYYGTQRGEGLTINCVFPKSDNERLTLLRRLMAYRGDVYVREPSGLGYWANVKVSYNRDYSDLTIPVTINVTPVEGGM